MVILRNRYDGRCLRNHYRHWLRHCTTYPRDARGEGRRHHHHPRPWPPGSRGARGASFRPSGTDRIGSDWIRRWEGGVLLFVFPSQMCWQAAFLCILAKQNLRKPARKCFVSSSKVYHTVIISPHGCPCFKSCHLHKTPAKDLISQRVITHQVNSMRGIKGKGG